ncbi:hypothetical protein SK667_2014 [Streptococcus mitis]|nr:hypothetical protein SK667_2014 [Streptococcus mitis]
MATGRTLNLYLNLTLDKQLLAKVHISVKTEIKYLNNSFPFPNK